MIKIIKYHIAGLFAAWILIIMISCNGTGSKKAVQVEPDRVTQPRTILKPPATYQDTLIINFPAAVLFHPDSLQLLSIKAQTDSMVFDGTMHEYFYQMRNARMVIKKDWPGLSIVEAKRYRYILFVKNDNSREYIDLDTKPDACGLLVFNRKKSPLFVDMTNLETAFSFYLKE